MIAPEVVVRIRHLFFSEHWKIGTIATELELHHDTVRAAVATDGFNRARHESSKRLIDPYREFIEQTLREHPRLRATRIFQMAKVRGYTGGVCQLRRLVAQLRPAPEAFLRLHTFPGQQGQADWAHCGEVAIGRGRRRLSLFVITLSWSRALALRFFFDQTLESMVRAHVEAFAELGGCPRTMLYDNMKSAVLARRGSWVDFNPRLLQLAAHYHFTPHACRPARGNEKGRVERAIHYIRDSFLPARPFTNLDDFNRQARLWRDQVAHQRRWAEDGAFTVAEALVKELPSLAPLPAHPFESELLCPARSGKTIYLRFDRNDYSIPPRFVGRTLTLAVSPETVRVLDGAVEIASHRRSWDRGATVEDPAHRQELLDEKRRAMGASPGGRLQLAVPESNALLDRAFDRGESIGRATTQLLQLLDDYGPSWLRAAIVAALESDSPRLASVSYLLEQRRRAERFRAPRPVDLTRRPDLADLHVEPHSPHTYDELSDTDQED